MKYRLRVNLTEEDFYKFNEFVILRSPYGKKSLNTMRVAVAAIIAIFAAITLVSKGINRDSIISIIPLLILLVIVQIIISPMMKSSLKNQIKVMKQTGKLAFSPESVIEFYEDSFTEETTENKNEIKYTAVERVSVLQSGMIYIHINSAMAYIVPKSVFESEGQYAEFEAFLREKVQSVVNYKK